MISEISIGTERLASKIAYYRVAKNTLYELEWIAVLGTGECDATLPASVHRMLVREHLQGNLQRNGAEQRYKVHLTFFHAC